MSLFDTALYADYETRSLVDLPKTGVFPYAHDASTEILMCGTLDEVARKIGAKANVIENLSVKREYIRRNHGVVISWGSFDREIFKHVEPRPFHANWFNAMEIAYMMGWPAKLEMLSRFLGYEQGKDKRGSLLINQYSKPITGTTEFRPLMGDDLKAYKEYCAQDVDLMADIFVTHLKPLLPIYLKYQGTNFRMVERMNQAGMPIDVESCELAFEAFDKAKERAAEECEEITGFRVTQTARLAEWLGLPNVRKTTLEASYPLLDEQARQVVDLRLASSKAQKLEAMIKYASVDGRAHFAFQNNGAHTGRLAGRGPQFQNMKRTKYDPEIFNENWGTKSMGEISDAMRGFVKAPPGRTLMFSDYGQIEARVGAWLANELKLLNAFRAGHDVYKMMAANICDSTVAEIMDGSDERQQGKVTVLAGQYQVSGYGLMIQAVGYGIVGKTEKEWNAVVRAYRGTMTNIVSYWWQLQDAVLELAQNPKLRKVDWIPNVTFDRWRDDFIRMILPSGRPIFYYEPRVERMLITPKDPEKDPFEKDVVLYRNKEGWQSLYGGKIFENLVQATSTDIVMHGGYNAEKAGFPLLAQVHDEWGTEINEGEDRLDEFNALLCDTPEWAREIPIVADGWIGPRYKK